VPTSPPLDMHSEVVSVNVECAMKGFEREFGLVADTSGSHPEGQMQVAIKIASAHAFRPLTMDTGEPRLFVERVA
jgi:hypothetical protein